MHDVAAMHALAVGSCVLVMASFYATLHSWQKKSNRVPLYSAVYWLQPVCILDVPREGEDPAEGVTRDGLRFWRLAAWYVVAFVVLAPLMTWASWSDSKSLRIVVGVLVLVSSLLVPILATRMFYGEFVFRRHLIGWQCLILLVDLLGYECSVEPLVLKPFLDKIPASFLGEHGVKILVVGIVLFCWRASAAEFKSWKADVQSMRMAVPGLRHLPLPPDWSMYSALTDFIGAIGAIAVTIVYVG
jgi:hypothetical protein